MAPKKSKAPKLRDPTLFPRPSGFDDSVLTNWSIAPEQTSEAAGGWADYEAKWYKAVTAYVEGKQTDDWDTSTPDLLNKNVEEEKVVAWENALEKNLEGWPWVDGSRDTITIGPFWLNERPQNVLGLSPQPQKGSFLMRIMDIEGIGMMIIDLLFKHHSSAWKFAFTCQKAQHLVSCALKVWDLASLNFNGCEIEPPADGSGDERTVGLNLVVAYLRGPDRQRMENTNTLYESQIWATYQLCRAVQWRGHYFTRLHLHRVAFLTVDVLNLIIPQMTRLKVLGVYRCPLIHIGHAMKLLEIIQVDRMKGRECQVSLDFYPRLHVGPVADPGNVYVVGGFGATWEDWQGPTDRAIWSIVYRFAMQCAKQGIDALSTNTQFRKWLEDGPCYDVKNTIAAMNTAFHFDEIARGPPYKPKEKRKYHLGGRLIEENELFDLYPELTEVIILIDQRNPYHEGDIKRFFTENTYKRPEGMEWMYLRYRCTSCETLLPGVFFHYPDVKSWNEYTNFGKNLAHYYEIPCLGCRMHDSLQKERDHFKRKKNKIMEDWTSDYINEEKENVVNTKDLGKFIDVFFTRNIAARAAELDDKRLRHVQRHGFDKETEELQVPVTDQVIRSKRGAFLSAPKIGDWKKELQKRKIIKEDPSMKQWLRGDATKHLVHHRHYG